MSGCLSGQAECINSLTASVTNHPKLSNSKLHKPDFLQFQTSVYSSSGGLAPCRSALGESGAASSCSHRGPAFLARGCFSSPEASSTASSSSLTTCLMRTIGIHEAHLGPLNSLTSAAWCLLLCKVACAHVLGFQPSLGPSFSCHPGTQWSRMPQADGAGLDLTQLHNTDAPQNTTRVCRGSFNFSCVLGNFTIFTMNMCQCYSQKEDKLDRLQTDRQME